MADSISKSQIDALPRLNTSTSPPAEQSNIASTNTQGEIKAPTLTSSVGDGESLGPRAESCATSKKRAESTCCDDGTSPTKRSEMIQIHKATTESECDNIVKETDQALEERDRLLKRWKEGARSIKSAREFYDGSIKYASDVLVDYGRMIEIMEKTHSTKDVDGLAERLADYRIKYAEFSEYVKSLKRERQILDAHYAPL